MSVPATTPSKASEGTCRRTRPTSAASTAWTYSVTAGLPGASKEYMCVVQTPPPNKTSATGTLMTVTLDRIYWPCLCLLTSQAQVCNTVHCISKVAALLILDLLESETCEPVACCPHPKPQIPPSLPTTHMDIFKHNGGGANAHKHWTVVCVLTSIFLQYSPMRCPALFFSSPHCRPQCHHLPLAPPWTCCTLHEQPGPGRRPGPIPRQAPH